MRTREWTTVSALLLFLVGTAVTAAEPLLDTLKDGRSRGSGLVLPLPGAEDDTGIILRNHLGDIPVRWTDKTDVAVMIDTRQFRNIERGVLKYRVPFSGEMLKFRLPKGPITGITHVKNIGEAREQARAERWISEFGLVLRFGQEWKNNLPTRKEPKFVGQFAFGSEGNTLTIHDAIYDISLKKGRTTARIHGLIGTNDVKPYVTSATVIGKLSGEVLVAEEVRVHLLGDSTYRDKPDLPRYLFIGDTVSGNYEKGLRNALKDKVNVHHPPTSCGATHKGRDRIVRWLGDFEQPGRHWDVISFNFGLWDASSTKERYQANLELIIARLKKTGARLIWVNTTPVPKGYDPAGKLTASGKAPGRTTGVMHQYLNPWALEVMRRHPEIRICDHWGFVRGRQNGLFKDWWEGTNVHFNSKQGGALGRFLARNVAEALEIELE